MAEITKTYRQDVGPLRFIGKKYGEADRQNGGFGHKWGEWFENGWFGALEGQIGGSAEEDGDATIGLMRWKMDDPFEYWIGMFAPQETAVPEGFESVDFPQGALGVCWVYGEDGEVYGWEEKCAAKLKEEGFEVVLDEAGAWWFFERYVCPRFTTPDDGGKIVLDVCHFVK